jgi:Domain of unknown function (DUF4249)
MNKLFFLISIISLLLISCETEFTPTDIQQEADIVVEGYIEASDRALPPYVILTRSANFFREFDPNKLEQYLVRNALVTITDGKTIDTLPQFCLNSLTPQQKQLVSGLLGFNSDSIGGADLCVYINPFGKIQPKQGGTYTLSITADGKKITSTTTIPKHVALDSLRFIPTPNNVIDSMVQLRGYVTDPKGVKNFYRNAISSEGGTFRSSTNSAVNDNFFDGKPSFEFPLSKPSLPNQENFNFETAGLYKRGEKVTVKYMSIDEATFNFWETAAQSAQNQGPFSTYTRIKSNVKGGLGVWMGVSASYYDIQAPK